MRRRQVTKRKFNIIGIPNVLQNVQTDKNVSSQPRDSTQKLRGSAKKSKTTKQNVEIDAQVSKSGTGVNESGSRVNESGTRDGKSGTRVNKSDTRINKSGTRDNKSGTRDNKSGTRNRKSGTPDVASRSTRSRGEKNNRVSSSPLALLKEQKENEASKDPDVADIDSDKDEVENGPTSQKLRKFGLAEDTPPPGDVSVSFLASTPKPGRPQLSRRRPMSPVVETLVVPLSSQDTASSQEQNGEDFSENHVIKQQKMNTTQKHKNENLLKIQMDIKSPRKGSPLKLLPQKQSPLKRSPQKQTPGGRINEKIASLNRTRLEKKRKNSEIHTTLSVNDKEISLTKSRLANKSVSKQTDNTLTTRSGTKKQKVSEPVRDIQLTSWQDQQDSLSESEGTDVTDMLQADNTESDKSVKVSGGTKSRGNSQSVNKNKNAQTSTPDGANNFSKTQESGRNIGRIKQRKNLTSGKGDETVQDSNSEDSLSSHRRKSAVNRKLQTLSRTNDTGDTSAADVSAAIDQTMMVWETEGQKRTRSDLIDLDVVLNTVTETLAARMDVYDTDEEQSAVHVLEKYLTQDITHMIEGVQTVMELQSKIKKCGQSIKQKQKSLMALQKERIEMEEKCQPLKKAQEDNENLTAINQFLKDLGKIIDKC
ncbi:dentin sialophosphoprotein-like isoform X2 [Mercenaria mercenaria]|uniref:dentin sialophosphoprotein-like isoform X2 n=1 Tax=Mercenaria mercenaria TaxID=6596 RepID=UPI00234EDD96|nr:dentin sialophosphoprotein-like isoform X2 [Mercenaria mercenaria]